MWKQEVYEVKTLFNKINTNKKVKVSVPGSKSITNRALLIATLADGISELKGTLFSDDSRHFLQCVQELGFETEVDEAACMIKVHGLKGKVPKRETAIYVGSAGTAARFLTAFLGVSDGVYKLDASEQMRKRPMAPLLHTLEGLGTEVDYELEEGCFPFTLRGKPVTKDQMSVNIEKSSQFLSALLIASTCFKEDVTISLEGTHGMAYIDMTIKMMKQFGLEVRESQAHQYFISKGQTYEAKQYQIEPDVSAACYFYGMAALLGIEVIVENVFFDSLQGDIQFISFLEEMGCTVEETPEGICVKGPADGKYKGITADMHACSDQAITLAALAPFADSPTVIKGIGHIKYQESNRIQAITTELRKMGIRCEEDEDGITIYPGEPTAAIVETYDDHRMAMGFSLIGLRAEGVTISDPMCCRKTFEKYFEVLEEVVMSLRD